MQKMDKNSCRSIANGSKKTDIGNLSDLEQKIANNFKDRNLTMQITYQAKERMLSTIHTA